MLNRRHLILGTLAASLLRPSASLAQDNPMPEELRQAIERQPFSPVLGNPKGNITLTEFFDYNCPICRTVPPLLQALISQDKQLRIVLREWPVIRPDSEVLARISLATLKQGKYWQFHHQMLSEQGRRGEKAAMATAETLGLDMAKLKRDMDGSDVSGHISQSMDLGDHMGLTGTPTFIAGHTGAFGRQSLDELKALVATARRQLS